MEQKQMQKQQQNLINRQSELIGEYRQALWSLKNKIYNLPENLQSIGKAKHLLITEIELLLSVTASPETFKEFKTKKENNENISV
jgi:hypothetical protein